MTTITSRSRRAGRPVSGVVEAEDRRAADLAAAAATAACVAAACVVQSLFDPRAERIFDEPKVLILRSVAAIAAASALMWAIAGRRFPSGGGHLDGVLTVNCRLADATFDIEEGIA